MIRQVILEHPGPLSPRGLILRVGMDAYVRGLCIEFTLVWRDGRQVVVAL